LSQDARPVLFSPLEIGPVTAPNRIVCGAHFTQFVEPATTVVPGRRCGSTVGQNESPNCVRSAL